MGDGQRIPEVVLASEQVQLQNLRAVIEYVRQSRETIIELDQRVITLRNMVMTQDGTIKNLKDQVAALQQHIYGGGTG